MEALCFLIGIIIIYTICDKINEKKIIEERISEEQNIILNEKKQLEMTKIEVRKIAEDNKQNSPWLAQRYADFWEMNDTNLEDYLKNKIHSAPKAAEIISEIKKQKRELLKENKMLKYQFDFLLDTYPWLEVATQEDVQQAREYVEELMDRENKDISEEEQLKKYISPEEYIKLSNEEKYQLALDRYLNKKHKSLWAIGVSFERYVGYLCEIKGYKVRYTGALEGVHDLGRDIIAENDNRIIVIQCKYWRKEREIRAKDIMYFYGTVTLEQKKNPNKKMDCIFATTTTLTDEARNIAEILNIDVRENMNFDKTYPCIKCNINKSTGEKIYHLPFDQQYDRISIELQRGECYAATVKEAEKLGFRKAKKHYF